MKLRELSESSDLTFRGSNTPDLIASKIWLADKLLELDQKFSTVYILGSWYGNMGFILNEKGVPFDKLINVDTNKEYLDFSNELLKKAGIDNVESMHKDANELNYRQVDGDSLVINTSVQDIEGTKWWDNIPKGITVALQCRNNVDNQKHSNLEEFDQDFPMSKTIFVGQKKLEDPELGYIRFMKIGIK